MLFIVSNSAMAKVETVGINTITMPYHSRHGERQNHLAEYAVGGSQVLRSLNQIVVHLLKGVVNGYIMNGRKL